MVSKKIEIRLVVSIERIIHIGHMIWPMDALNVLKKNLYRPRNFSDIGSFANMGTGRNLAQNREIWRY
jgi:hypothetical protein